jgi:hypothetical protein
MNHRRLLAAAVALSLAALSAFAQRGPQRVVSPPKAAAPIDLTGYWVSIVTEDWRHRMLPAPLKGDYESLPLTDEARKVAGTWDPAKDEAAGLQCRAYGAPFIMHQPGRLHVTWENDFTVRIETDAGMQTRVLHFDGKPEQAGAPQWQGYSVADWYWVPGWPGGNALTLADRSKGQGIFGRALKVVTTHMRPGYLRKNGVPYSENAVMTEYFNRFDTPNGASYMVVTSTIDDPQYLNQPFVTAVHFRKQADAAGWNPTPCTVK